MKDYQLEWNMLWEKQQELLWSAKIFIRDNFWKVIDYSELMIFPMNGNTVDNSNKKKMGSYMPLSHIPTNHSLYIPGTSTIASLEVILNEHDGDLSLNITDTEGNYKEWWWIDNESVITLAAYIARNIPNS